MLGVLTSDQIESLLQAEIVARIGYIDRRGLPCIVPITFAYDGRAIYGYSLLGAKIESMSAEPRVCVEVDRVQGAADWTSVVLRGVFGRLEGEAAVNALDLISARLRMLGSATTAPATASQTFVARTGGAGIAYRIDITEKRGRYSSSARVKPV
ncbi:MAG: pyridoxamine 5'-phosphate oxidase family protein [Candidatus Cybelea sp.]|jgi:nitroimidazol reductase NimA-like FMN-containing flavoprotein (pyridoxamine 5'-phosphate oxidase superfamily)